MSQQAIEIMTMLRSRTPRMAASALALSAVLAFGACTTVEDTWDSTWDAVFGDDESAATPAATATSDAPAEEGADATAEAQAARPAADGLVASPRRAYDEAAGRREPTVRHALVEESAETQVASRPASKPAERIEREPVRAPSPQAEQAAAVAPPPPAPAPDRVPMSAASGDALAGAPAQTMRPLPLAAAQPLAPAGTPEQGLLIAPASGAGTDSIIAYGDEAANGLGTTVIGGDGSVAIEPYVPVEYVAGGGVREGVYASEYDGPYAGRGLARYDGPQSMDAFNPDGAGVSTLVATIQFAHGSHGLSAHDRKILRQVVELQKRYGGSIRVIGHASSRTANMTMDQHKMANFTTSAARAEAVTDALVRLGAPRQQIYSAAVSDNEPVYYEIMPSGEAGNRRAEIYLDY